MEKDTVLLSVYKYNELRDFKNRIERGYTIRYLPHYLNEPITFITKEEACKELVCEIEELNKVIDRLNKPKPKTEKSIYEIKKMSIWQFLKWRKS